MAGKQNLCGLFKLAYVALMTFWPSQTAFTLPLMLALAICVAPPTAVAQGALEADSISLNEESGQVQAIGNVRLSGESGALQTDKLFLDRANATIDVPVPLILQDGEGTQIAADAARLSQKLDTGNFTNLRLLPAEGGRFAAAQAEKTGDKMRLKQAVFTACPPCAEDQTAAPLWQIRAAQIDYDAAAQDVSYRHSRLELFGLPVVYLPYMAHAGPEVVKRSGFLAPALASSGEFGAAVETPYFFDLAPNYDLTLTPRVSEKQDPFLTADWRHLTRNGRYQFTAYTHAPKDALRDETSHTQRGGVIGSGAFSLGAWSLNIDVQEASDDLFFRSYRLNTAKRLQSRLVAARSFGRHRLSLSGYRYRNTVDAETDATVDRITPRVQHDYFLADGFLGGNIAMRNLITRSERDRGIDTTHAQSLIDWSARHVTNNGFVLSAQNRLVIDAYDHQADSGDTIGNIAAATVLADSEDLLAANALALSLAYPLQRVGRSDSQTLTPQIQLVGATDNEDYESVPHIADTTLDLSRAQIFRPLAPQDEVSRVNLGLAHTLSLGPKLQTEFFLGQSYNLSDRDTEPTLMSGYGQRRSSIVADWALYAGPLSLTQQARFDKTGAELQRSESTARLGFGQFGLAATHSFYQTGQTNDNPDADLEEASGRIDWQIGQYWRFAGASRENLETGQTVRADAELTYEDDCTIAKISLTRDYATISGTSIAPETSINFTFTLKTIGG